MFILVQIINLLCYFAAGRIVNASGPVISVMTGEMYESDSVEIRLVVRKDGRKAEAVQEVYIAAGDPPVFGLEYVWVEKKYSLLKCFFLTHCFI
jgi:hypothetical protein